MDHRGKSKRRKTQGVKGGRRLLLSSRNANLGLGLEKKNPIYTCFFLSVGLVEPAWFNRFQTLKTETEQELFCDFLIG